MATSRANTGDGLSPISSATQKSAATPQNHQPRIAFNVCRKEMLRPSKGYRLLSRKLRQCCVVEENKEDITLDNIKGYDVLIISIPAEPITDADLEVLRAYMDQGGSVLMLFGDAHDGKYAYLNPAFTSNFGVKLNDDCVVGTVLQKFFHPKEVCVTNGVINEEFNRPSAKGEKNPLGQLGGKGEQKDTPKPAAGPGVTPLGINAALRNGIPSSAVQETKKGLVFAYPHGLTMTVERPAIPILTSGVLAYPLNCPICAVWESSNEVEHNGRTKHGRLMLMGSGLMLDDTWLEKQDNEKLAAMLFDYLLNHSQLNSYNAEEPNISKYEFLPDTASLSERLRVAVDELEDLPNDFTKLFNFATFNLDTDMIPATMEVYQKLNIKQEALTLISPEFQSPLPPILPATFGPIHREPAPPALDLFDLDEQFAPERVQLAQLTNKCKPEDVEHYIARSAEIMGVTKKLRSPRNRDPRALLDYIFRQVVQYKKVSSEPTNHAVEHGSTNLPGGSGIDSMTRVLHVSHQNDGSTDSTPFPMESPWTLQLQANFSQGTIQGSLELLQDTPHFPAQHIALEGTIAPPETREFPLEWGCVVVGHTGETTFFVFMGQIQGNTLRGVVDTPQSGGASLNFLYNIQEM